ncbi:MAG: BA14K family protein [Pararhodobacter sp.]|nr:BA14K family protein [Pararhodobacter sp.]
MTRTGFPAMAAALIGGAVLMFGSDLASATALPVSAVATPSAKEFGTTGLVKEARNQGNGGNILQYDRRRHGERHQYRRPGFTYHYGGYYYSNPWWLRPGVGSGVAPPTQLPSAHVEWCSDRYRSYDVATDTYVPRIGVRARCDSPYLTR